MAIGNPSFDAIASTTIKNFMPQFSNNLSSNVALYYWLTKKERVKPFSGGQSIVEPLMYGQNTTAGTYAGYDTLDMTPQAGLTAAEFPLKQHAVTIAISGLEKEQNRSKEQVINLLEGKIQQAELTAIEQFETMFLGDGTGNGGKNFLGISALVGNQSSGVTNVGGIDCTDALNTWWRSFVDTTAGALTLKDVNNLYNKLVRGADKPDVAFTTLALYESYESLLSPQQRFTDASTAQAGFTNLLVKGATNLFFAPAAVAGEFTMLNSTYIKLRQSDQTWMKHTDTIQPANQDAYFSHILSTGNLTINNRVVGGGKLTART